jgi:hypothetical protein
MNIIYSEYLIINLKIQLSNIFHLLNYLRLLIRSEN